MQPETRTFAVLVLDAKALGVQTGKSEADAKTFYNAHIKEFTTPEKRTVQQVSAGSEEAARAVYEKALSSKDLKQAAADAGKGKAQFLSGTYTRDDFIPAEIAESVFKAAEGKVLEPMKGPLGWHVVEVSKITPAVIRSFEEARADVEKAMAASGAGREALYARAGEIDDMIAGGKTLAEVAQHFGLQEKVFDKVTAAGLDAAGKKNEAKDVPAFEKVLEAAFRLESGATSEMMEAPTGEFLLVETREVSPEQARDFDTVKAEVTKAWKDSQAGRLLDTTAIKITERLNAGESIGKIAAEFNKPVQKVPSLQRGAPPEKTAGFEQGVLVALFSIEKPGQATSVPSPGAVTIIQLAARGNEAPKEPGREDFESLQSMLSQALQSDILEQFRRSLMAKYDVTINEGVLQEMYAPKDEQGP
jgi:peptidyl-prolyl cis-trans isomerase D